MFLLGIMLFVLSKIFAFNTGGPICSVGKMAYFFVPSARFISMPSYFSVFCQGSEICSMYTNVDIPYHDYRLFFPFYILIIEVGSTGSKKGHVFKSLSGPPQMKVLCILVSKTKKFWKLVKNPSVGAILKSRGWENHQKCPIFSIVSHL